MESTRLNKIGRLIQKELGDIFQKQTQGMPGILISVSAVRVSPDLGVAKAEVTIVVAQVIVAYIIELMGLFGSKKADFSWLKLLALIIAMGGVFMFYNTGKN